MAGSTQNGAILRDCPVRGGFIFWCEEMVAHILAKHAAKSVQQDLPRAGGPAGDPGGDIEGLLPPRKPARSIEQAPEADEELRAA